MNVQAAAPQSSFVTGLAWISIVLNGLGVFGALMQNVMVNLLMPTMFGNPNTLPAQAFPLNLFRVLALIFLAYAAFMTWAAYALLRRRDWARVTFIVICALSIAWSVLSVLMAALGFGVGGLLPAAGMTPQMHAVFNTMLTAMLVVCAAICVLFGWIIRRLTSPQIKAEFS